jgi:hypothetical protein
MTEMIACCGLDCGACEAYLATASNDQVKLEELAAKWRTDYNSPDITIAQVSCMGCSSESGPWCGYCAECGIRKCANEHGFATCAECTLYPCEQLSGFFKMAPAARDNLENLRK